MLKGPFVSKAPLLSTTASDLKAGKKADGRGATIVLRFRWALGPIVGLWREIAGLSR
jgi:hypothetical protein